MSGSGEQQFPFDEVEISIDAVTRKMSPAEFLALPLPLRITSILEDKARFKRGAETVDARAALAELRKLRISL